MASNDRANLAAARLGRGVVTVVPITSNTDRIFPLQALLPAAATGLHAPAKAQAEQVRSIAVERLGAVLGRVPADVIAHIDDALRLHLQL
ncbi:MAG TPA: type II toxin-antitoxin system PemK/MazF family toxin [Nocardioides sp.]|jgi:mRNA interferase MazF|uniref:type II toxin-antitoxin system PemK/MazF family toxin n=1 Tax=Nocardioides sp. TaxID=35761 RepID=UPI002E32A4C4|nr:type II toxin-antitoxin system PemK/MazF family toxin [Nocardioides sp.]HEX3931974.1 type II toxin-antitoxin system PemK/MazF family toxin [Nocardioides sp.]